jgi:hypothetical protein
MLLTPKYHAEPWRANRRQVLKPSSGNNLIEAGQA